MKISEIVQKIKEAKQAIESTNDSLTKLILISKELNPLLQDLGELVYLERMEGK